jgi:hypothetical protein
MNETTIALGRRTGSTTRTWLVLAAAAAAVLVMIILIAMVRQGTGEVVAGGVEASPSSTASAAGGLGAGSGPDDAAGGPDDDGGGPPGPAPAPPSGQGGPADQQPVGPVIEVFQVTQQPQCPGGTTLNPIEAQPVALQWTVTGADADQVSLSIDGPGVYNTYPAEGGDVINFPCEGEEGDIQEHTYLLTAVGDGVTVTETLVVTAKVQQVTELSLTTDGD